VSKISNNKVGARGSDCSISENAPFSAHAMTERGTGSHGDGTSGDCEIVDDGYEHGVMIVETVVQQHQGWNENKLIGFKPFFLEVHVQF
jgi:hypothetical protein